MIRASIFIATFFLLCFLFSKLRARLSSIPIAISAFCVALATSGLLARQQEIVLSNTASILEELWSQFGLIPSIISVVLLLSLLYLLGSIRIVKEGEAAIVERLGKYRCTLAPGLNLIVPLLDVVALADSLREQTLSIEPQTAITKDNVSVIIEVIIFWRIFNIERTYYAVEDVEYAMESLTSSTLINEVGKIELLKVFTSQELLNRVVVDVLDEATAPWGIKVNRVESLNISAPPGIQESIEAGKSIAFQEEAYSLKARRRYEEIANLTKVESQATSNALQEIYNALPGEINGTQILNYLIEQRYIDSNTKLAASDNSKLIYMNPKVANDVTENSQLEKHLHLDPAEQGSDISSNEELGESPE